MPKEWPAPHLLGPALAVREKQVIARAGFEVRSLHLIEQGVVGRFIAVGEASVLDAVRCAGWLLGAVPAMTTGRFEATITAMTACVLRPIPVGTFRRAVATLETSRWLNDMLAADLFAHTSRSAAVANGSTRSLIEELFVELMGAVGKRLADGSVRLTLELSVVDLAGLVGVSREHATRVLGELESEGHLTKQKGWFVAPIGSSILARLHRSAASVMSHHM